MRKYQMTPMEKREEIVLVCLSGDNSYEELGKFYNVDPKKISVWVNRYRKSKKIVSLHADTKPLEEMARKKKEEKSPEVLSLEARILELELQDLALNTLIDVAEKNGIDIRKNWGPSRQAFYMKKTDEAEHLAREIRILDAVCEIRENDSGIGGVKLWLMLCVMFNTGWMPGRDKFMNLLRQHGLMQKPRKSRSTTNSNHRYHKRKNLVLY